jgi:hypothetical protein
MLGAEKVNVTSSRTVVPIAREHAGYEDTPFAKSKLALGRVGGRTRETLGSTSVMTARSNQSSGLGGRLRHARRSRA